MKRSRVLKNEEPHHILTIQGDRGSSFVLVGPRKRQYLSVHPAPGETHALISGPETLRALARAILGQTRR